MVRVHRNREVSLLGELITIDPTIYTLLIYPIRSPGNLHVIFQVGMHTVLNLHKRSLAKISHISRLCTSVTAGALMHLLQQVGTAYQYLHGYDLATSLRCFRSLPPRHRGSAWCLTQMARAYHCGERYCQAAKLFREVHSMDPHRQDGMGTLTGYFYTFC